MNRPGSRKRPWALNAGETPRQAMEGRGRDPFYHTTRWKKESQLFRQINPLCKECEKEGIIAPGGVTDHIIPKDICSNPWDWSNWQNLCKKHHARKAARDKRLINKTKK